MRPFMEALAMTKRPNKTGNVYRRGNTWTARVVDHWLPSEMSKSGMKPVWKTKGGFAKKKDAINYLPELYKEQRHDHPPKTFYADYLSWVSLYSPRVSSKTMEGYKQAFAHYEKLHYVKINNISAVDLQQCIDNCGKGKRTRQLMKVTAGLVFKYAIDDNQILKNCAQNLYIEDQETHHYEPLTDEEIDRISRSGEFYADYIVALCYLGHRPSEFFSFTKSDYYHENGVSYIKGGIKTEAGKSRVVPIPARIQPIIERRLAVEGTDLLFPRYDLNRKQQLSGTFSVMPTRYFNQFVWKPMMDRLGIVGKVPYSTRHTYSNKIKNISGSDKDKAQLMGHADYETTKKHYQSTSLAELKALSDQIK